MITCRRATDTDVALFKEIRLKALIDSPDAFGSTYESASKRSDQSWQEQLSATTAGSDRNTQFAFQDGHCIGLAAVYRLPSTLEAELLMMWVAPPHRGTRAASMLITNLLQWAKESGIEQVSLEVTDSNSRAISFYQTQGFNPTGEEVAIDSDRNLKGIRMVKLLPE